LWAETIQPYRISTNKCGSNERSIKSTFGKCLRNSFFKEESLMNDENGRQKSDKR
jgi:hypothetical protein